MEQIVKSINVFVEAYHGGDVNRKIFQTILNNTKGEMDDVTTVILEQRRKDTHENNASAIQLMQNYEQLLGKLDSTLAQLTIIDPT